MRVVVTFKLGSEAGFTRSQECDLDPKEHERLRADWDKHVKDPGSIHGGVYKIRHRDEDRALFLRFTDVLYME
jgi:hypothetical protein